MALSGVEMHPRTPNIKRLGITEPLPRTDDQGRDSLPLG